jgi:hypothetical protein
MRSHGPPDIRHVSPGDEDREDRMRESSEWEIKELTLQLRHYDREVSSFHRKRSVGHPHGWYTSDAISFGEQVQSKEGEK